MGDFYWDSPNRQISPNVADMQRNLMTLGGMGTPTLDPHKSQKELMKDFMIRSLMMGPLGTGVRSPNSVTTNPIGNPGIQTPSEVFGNSRITGITGGKSGIPGNTNVNDVNQHIMDILKDADPSHWVHSVKKYIDKGVDPFVAEHYAKQDVKAAHEAAKPRQEGQPGPPTAKELEMKLAVENLLKDKTGFPKKGNMYPADMYGTLPEANLNPGWRHPEMPEPFYGPNIAKGDKFDAAWIQQQIKQKGYDPSKLTYDQMLKIMHDEKP